MDGLDEIVGEFLVESAENLDQLDRDLVALEQEPSSRELLSSIFRTIHTIKGTSGFLAFTSLESVTHVGENLLSRLRDGALVLTPRCTDLLLQMVDTVRHLLATIEATGGEGDTSVDAVVARINAYLEAPEAPAPEPEAVVEPVVHIAPEIEPERSEAPMLGELLVATGAVSPAAVAEAVESQLHGDQRPIGEILVEHGDAEPAVIEAALETQAKRNLADSTIRVDVDLLDGLMRMVGELVLARNQVVQHAAVLQDNDLSRSAQRLGLIVSELQEGLMKTRMQPIDHVWSRLPRVVRDLGQQCGKQVRLEMDGRETELDKSLLEAVKDPITHLVRNAVDHGIETPEQRVAAGKAAIGTLSLRAFHESGQVVIEVSDDGRGVDPAKVGAKAVERGLITPDQLRRMSDRELVELIFRPGFSTAAAVTNVSGRGVGMDVVRTNIEKIGGTVDIAGRPGQGTTVRVKIPLTLAIIPALVVGCAGERFAIPQASLVELVRLEGEAIRSGVERVGGAVVHRLRGRLLPLVGLGELLGLDGSDPYQREACTIVVLQADGSTFGLVVDDVHDTQEIVVKPLGSLLKNIGVFAGATIMGDGQVALILDSLGLAQRAGVAGVSRAAEAHSAGTAGPAAGGDTMQLLVVEVGDGRRVAVPLEAVARLEEFSVDAVERAGDREVVQYRGEILPLVRLERWIAGTPGGTSATDQPLAVVVHRGESSVGLVVDRILDVVEESIELSGVGSKPGLLGSAVVQRRVTEVLDVAALAALGAPRRETVHA